MVAVDTNILVYAHRGDSPWHTPASRVIIGLAEGRASWAIPWPCLYEFLAIVTHPRIYNPPTPLRDARLQMRNLLESPSLVLIGEDEGFFQVLDEILDQSAVSGGSVHDARIAAICMRHGVETLLSADRDFSRFRSLRVENPLL